MSPNVFVYIRHGIWSSPRNMLELENAVKAQLLPGSFVDNKECVKGESILFNGIVLAETVLRGFSKSQGTTDRILLIGHSQGGLVCRVAAAAICAPEQLVDAISEKTRYIDKSARDKSNEKLDFLLGENFGKEYLHRCAGHLVGVVTLATPNAGAMTNGQLSLVGRGARLVLGGLADFFGQKTIDELTTGRLFRVLQHVRVNNVNYLSISGSWVNRYSWLNHDDLEWFPKGVALGPHLEKPNDGIVEDLSVDLRESPLPCEIDDLDKQYTHIRSYTDCLDIAHADIHSRQEVFGEMKKVFRGWGL